MQDMVRAQVRSKFNLSATGGSSTSLGGGDLKETFTSGTFSITNGATDLLSGSFTGGVLTTLNPSLGFATTTYDAASTSLGGGWPIRRRLIGVRL